MAIAKTASKAGSAFFNPNNASQGVYIPVNGSGGTVTAQQNRKNSYDPTGATQSIISAKGSGADATQWYDELRNNGYGDLADTLYNQNYTDSLGTLNNVSAGSQTAKSTAPYNDTYNMIAGDTKSPADYANTFNSISGNANQGLAESTINNLASTPVSDTVSGLINNYNNTLAQTNDYYNSLFNQGTDMTNKFANYDITATPYYNTIMQSYNATGNNASNDALASGTANNGGNIDSYSAANANAQQLAYTNAAYQTLIDLMNNNSNNALGWYTQNSNNVQTQAGQNNDMLNTAANMYATDAEERSNAANYASALRQQELQNDINQYLAALEADTTNRNTAANLLSTYDTNATDRYKSDNDVNVRKYESDNDLAGTKYTSDNTLAGTKYSADKSYASALANADASKYSALMSNDASKYSADRNYDSSKYTADKSYDTAVYKANNPSTTTSDDSTYTLTDYDMMNSAMDIINGNATDTNGNVYSFKNYASANGITEENALKQYFMSMGKTEKQANTLVDTMKNNMDLYVGSDGRLSTNTAVSANWNNIQEAVTAAHPTAEPFNVGSSSSSDVSSIISKYFN